MHPHDRFFFSDGSLYLLVENSLYCIHKSLIEIHASMFPVRELETSLTKPYVLGDVKKIDFDRLLANLYPRTLGVEETETTKDWISVLGLASKWGFESLRSRAISKIKQTSDSPIDMVTFGRQHGISDILLPGYAILCQSTVPLSYEEGLRLGVDDVVNIYRIRHKLYGSGITPVSLDLAFAKVKEAGLGDPKRPKQELDSKASTLTDVVATTSAENEERGSVTPTPNVNSPPLDVASTDVATLVSEKPVQRDVNEHLPSDESTSLASGNVGGCDVPSLVFPSNVSNLKSGPSESARECIKLVEELTTNNFDLISVKIMQWINTRDFQTLHHITRLMVEKALETDNGQYYEFNAYPRLCKTMVKNTQSLHQMTRLIVEKAMEEPRRISVCARLFKMMVKETNGRMAADGSLFGKYLGEICRENLEAMPAIIENWMTALLDADDEKKVSLFSFGAPASNMLTFGSDQPTFPLRGSNTALPQQPSSTGFNGTGSGQSAPPISAFSPLTPSAPTTDSLFGIDSTPISSPASRAPRQIKRLPTRRSGAKR